MSRRLTEALALAAVWAATVYGSYLGTYVLLGWTWGQTLFVAGIPFAIGAAMAGFITAFLLIGRKTRADSVQRFSRFFGLLFGLTLALTALIFVLSFRSYFSTWHEPFLSVPWLFQTFFTTLAAVFLFLGTALKVFVGLPFIVALILSFAFTRGALDRRKVR
ncbi:MAG: hypothetical protein AAGM04_09215 [Pseudomonadota bacterium]